MKLQDLRAEDQERYARMWTSDKRQWVLVRRTITLRGKPSRVCYGPINKQTKIRLLIEDNDLHEEVVTHMLNAGVVVLDELPPEMRR